MGEMEGHFTKLTVAMETRQAEALGSVERRLDKEYDWLVGQLF